MLASSLPDETLYGLMARNGRLRGDTLGSTTSRALFDHPDAGLHHDFPHHLERLSVNTHGHLGSVQEIMARLTTAPYFLRFKPPAVAISTQEAMAGIGIARLKHALGLPASLCRARLPLRACPECMEEDRELHGIASWQRKHQLPGSLFCSRHAAPLLESSLRIDRRGKTRFLLPEDIGVFKRAESSLLNSDATACLNQLANLNTHILERSLPQPYLRERIAMTYRHGLQANGLLTKGGSLRVQAYLNCLHSRFRSIQTLEPFCRALGEPHQATLLRMVRKPRSDFHPLYHSLLIDALFGGWEAFVAVYAWESGMSPAAVEYPSATPIAVPARISAFVAELNESGPERPILRLASQHGLDISTAIRWAGKLGISEIRRRPKVLHHALKTEVVKALLRGEPQRDIAQHTGLSRATIDRICQEEPERYAAWQAANKEWKRARAQADMLIYLAANPGATLADAHRASPSGYCWLRRHDAEWLRTVLPEKPRTATKRAHTRRFTVDWAVRDEQCFAQLCQLAATLTFEPGERLKPGTVLRKLPALPFSPRLERLPKSSALVDQILLEHIEKRRRIK